MHASRYAAVAVLLVATASFSMPTAAGAQPTTRSAATGEPVGGPALGSPGIVVRAGKGTTTLPPVAADSWVLADVTTGDVLAAKAAHLKVRPASTLKTLTAVTLMPVLAKDTDVVITADATHADGSHVGVVEGASYTLWDLWHGLLLPSGNDAAAAIADANGGMVPTVGAMQAKAVELGALDTTVRNPSGLDHPTQFTSAYDMALIARAALAIPDFAEVTRTASYDFPGKAVAAGATRATYKIYTQNRLLLHGFPGIVGGKTGFTSLAHRTFWGAASRGGHTLVVTLFNIHEPTEAAAKALLSWGFANLPTLSPVGTLVAPKADSEPSGTPTSTPEQPNASTGGGASDASSTAVSLGNRARGLVVPAIVLLALAALAWWLLARRAGRDPRPAVRTTPPSAAETPPSALDTARAPAGPSPLEASIADTGPVPGVTVAPDPSPEPGPATMPAPTTTTPPDSGGHVRLVRPPERPGG